MLREGRDAVVEAIARLLPEWRVPEVHGGVSLWIGLDAPLSSTLVMDVRSRGLLLSAGPRFSVEGGHDRHLRIPFTAAPDELVRAVGILADAWPPGAQRCAGGDDRAVGLGGLSGTSAQRAKITHSTASSTDQNSPRSRNARLGAWNRRAR